MPIPWIRSRSRSRRRQRGVSLIEILVVVAIMSLIAGAVGIGAYRAWQGAQNKTATLNARTIRGAVKSYWVTTSNGGCPTMGDLLAQRALDEDSPRKDPWGSAWRIECADDQVSVSSDGPDKRPGTEDDIRVPPLRRFDPAADDSS